MTTTHKLTINNNMNKTTRLVYSSTTLLLFIASLLTICESRGHRNAESSSKYGNGGLNLRLEIPRYPKVGDRLILGCKYDLGSEGTLYTVKWYRGPSEFYRYTPKESPPIKTFGFPGPEVDPQYSNATQFVIGRASLGMSGKYSCEVTTDSPDFTTELHSESLHVIQFPSSKPEISATKLKYSVGDYVDVNCTTHRSRPAANLTWYINNTPAQLLVSSTLEKERERDLTETSRLGLRFELQPAHFLKNKLRLQCNASIYDRYESSNEILIYQADNPQISKIVDTFTSSDSSSSSGQRQNHRLRGRSGATTITHNFFLTNNACFTYYLTILIHCFILRITL